MADPALPVVPADGAAQRVCARSDLSERGRAVVFDVLEFGRPVRAFVLRVDGVVVAYLNRCAHVPAEMDWQPGEFLDADRRYLLCAMHGAAYEPHDGRCVAGPCVGRRLTPLTVRELDDSVYWYPSRDIRPAAGPDAPSATVAAAPAAPTGSPP